MNRNRLSHLAQERIQVVPKASNADLDRIFRQLDSNRFKDREEASTELDRLGASVVGRVKARLEKNESEEVRSRVIRFLAKYDHDNPQADELRVLRGVEILEAIATAEAKSLLAALARGEETAPLTREAARAMQRIK